MTLPLGRQRPTKQPRQAYIYIYICVYIHNATEKRISCICVTLFKAYALNNPNGSVPHSPIGPGTTSLSGGGSRMYSSPTGRRGQATWRGCDHRFAHRPSSPHRSLWHATQRHHHAVDPRKNHLMSLQSWHEAGLRDPLVQGGEEGMCQVFCIRKSIVLKCKTKHAFRPFGGQKNSIPHQQEPSSLPGSHQRAISQ